MNSKSLPGAIRTTAAFILLCACSALSADIDSVRGQKSVAAIPDRLVVLTFDDACASHATFVAPLLKQYGFGATFFICEYPGFENKTNYMTWEQIKGLHDLGFEIGNHTLTHAHVDRLKKEKIIQELEEIETRCEKRGISKPTSFAYPAYANSPAAVKTIAEKGYRFGRVGGGQAYDPAKDNPLLIPSVSISGGESSKARVFAALREARDGKIVVLTVHGVPDLAHPAVSTPPKIFEEYMQFLRDNHYTVIGLRDLEKYVASAHLK